MTGLILVVILALDVSVMLSVIRAESEKLASSWLGDRQRATAEHPLVLSEPKGLTASLNGRSIPASQS